MSYNLIRVIYSRVVAWRATAWRFPRLAPSKEPRMATTLELPKDQLIQHALKQMKSSLGDNTWT
ncbi:hypothetical protein Q2443_26230, partial [Escherichia coli]|nr:hypothetical protein [Escherichia coli]